MIGTLAVKEKLIIAGIAIVAILVLIGVGARTLYVHGTEQEIRQVKEDIKQSGPAASPQVCQSKNCALIHTDSWCFLYR